jgi:hypothetical protein
VTLCTGKRNGSVELLSVGEMETRPGCRVLIAKKRRGGARGRWHARHEQCSREGAAAQAPSGDKTSCGTAAEWKGCFQVGWPGRRVSIFLFKCFSKWFELIRSKS